MLGHLLVIAAKVHGDHIVSSISTTSDPPLLLIDLQAPIAGLDSPDGNSLGETIQPRHRLKVAAALCAGGKAGRAEGWLQDRHQRWREWLPVRNALAPPHPGRPPAHVAAGLSAGAGGQVLEFIWALLWRTIVRPSQRACEPLNSALSQQRTPRLVVQRLSFGKGSGLAHRLGSLLDMIVIVGAASSANHDAYKLVERHLGPEHVYEPMHRHGELSARLQWRSEPSNAPSRSITAACLELCFRHLTAAAVAFAQLGKLHTRCCRVQHYRCCLWGTGW